MSRIQFDPQQAFKEFTDYTRKMTSGAQLLQRIKDEDVEIATAPKKEVFRLDKTMLYRYEPRAKSAVEVPVLVVYGLVGRYTMTDLQEDRSLHAQPARAGRRSLRRRLGHTRRAATAGSRIEDYVDGYLDDVRRVHLPGAQRRQASPARHLRRRRVLALLRGAVPAARART